MSDYKTENFDEAREASAKSLILASVKFSNLEKLQKWYIVTEVPPEIKKNLLISDEFSQLLGAVFTIRKLAEFSQSKKDDSFSEIIEFFARTHGDTSLKELADFEKNINSLGNLLQLNPLKSELIELKNIALKSGLLWAIKNYYFRQSFVEDLFETRQDINKQKIAFNFVKSAYQFEKNLRSYFPDTQYSNQNKKLDSDNSKDTGSYWKNLKTDKNFRKEQITKCKITKKSVGDINSKFDSVARADNALIKLSRHFNESALLKEDLEHYTSDINYEKIITSWTSRGSSTKEKQNLAISDADFYSIINLEKNLKSLEKSFDTSSKISIYIKDAIECANDTNLFEKIKSISPQNKRTGINK